jgi:hypothetical protein
MSAPQNIIAVIFDFDDTLTDESTTKLLEAHGVNTKDFWTKDVQTLIGQGWDPALAYLRRILDLTGEGRPLGKLTNQYLREFGSRLEFYPGIPGMFTELNALAAEHQISKPSVEFYIVSSGLEDLIRGSTIAKYFKEIWGCRFAEERGQVTHVMNSVSFTEKTKFLYAINKGLFDVRKTPYDVNKRMDEPFRRVPFKNMIYIGDGLTDVPCFSMLEKFGGKSFGVFDPQKEGSPKKAWETLVTPKRVTILNSPRYGAIDVLGALLRMAVSSICSEMELNTRSPFAS